ncbi:MAG: thioredoxin family protein [Anaerolineales bacterium]
MDEILARVAWAAAIVLSGFAAYRTLNRFLLWRLKKRSLGLEKWRPGIPAILYFTTPDCQPCKTQQRPALRKLSEQLEGRVQVIHVDATQHPDLADYWGVLTVPTTFVIDSKGQPRGMNHGVASAEKLHGQLEAAEGQSLLSSANRHPSRLSFRAGNKTSTRRRSEASEESLSAGLPNDHV